MIKRLIAFFLHYQIYYIYTLAATKETINPRKFGDCRPVYGSRDIDNCRFKEIKATKRYGGSDAHGFGWYESDELVAIAWYWMPSRYAHQRNFWPLKTSEAKLVQIVTATEFRSRGLAGRLIACSSWCLFDEGIDRIYARIWHSNIASIKAFEKVGWQKYALVLDIFPFGRHCGLRFLKYPQRKWLVQQVPRPTST